mmetsp:Transcript_33001/g.84952  ORF Transcript_33001/g.84952 Transcript_33001/m.84952 type:complete len:325 (-) Transcript_33001:471-1445(-)
MPAKHLAKNTTLIRLKAAYVACRHDASVAAFAEGALNVLGHSREHQRPWNGRAVIDAWYLGGALTSLHVARARGERAVRVEGAEAGLAAGRLAIGEVAFVQPLLEFRERRGLCQVSVPLRMGDYALGLGPPHSLEARVASHRRGTKRYQYRLVLVRISCQVGVGRGLLWRSALLHCFGWLGTSVLGLVIAVRLLVIFLSALRNLVVLLVVILLIAAFLLWPRLLLLVSSMTARRGLVCCSSIAVMVTLTRSLRVVVLLERILLVVLPLGGARADLTSGVPPSLRCLLLIVLALYPAIRLRKGRQAFRAGGSTGGGQASAVPCAQ